jgi:hypothetical protein
MRSRRIRFLLATLASFALTAPAVAQQAGGTPPAPAPSSPAAPGAAAPGAVAAPSAAAPSPAAPGATVRNAPNPPPTPPDADPAFLTGLRRVGVMAGQMVECSPQADRQANIAQAMDLANQIAVHFGLRAAFNFVGALGYGSGHPFDKADCPKAIDGWKQIQAKYLNK